MVVLSDFLLPARFVHQRHSTSEPLSSSPPVASVIKDTPEAQEAARELLAKSVREGIQSKAKSYEERVRERISKGKLPKMRR